MTVVSNTSPINYLTLIGLDRLLPTLFGRVIIPLAVREELNSSGAPPQITEMLSRSGGWLEAVRAPAVSDPILAGLDAGEMEAIGLAVSMKAELILMDEARGRRAASEHFGLRVTGTVGILDRAAATSRVDPCAHGPQHHDVGFRVDTDALFCTEICSQSSPVLLRVEY